MKKLLIILLIVGALGYAGYRFALSYASDEVMNQLSQELLTEDVVSELMADPSIRDVLEQFQGKNNETNTRDNTTAVEQYNQLPFTTKEEATKTIVSKFSVGEIRDFTTKAARGLTIEEQVEYEKLIMNRLSEEEIEAIMLIGLSELSEELLIE
ncbi:hypothetical protein QA612_02245 [Evansella sp. AB-P1]|uniref:hypothetical protein n=1 Tax=Evansella sp. AB-P1 TaxID=3037653 RepID=UPI00241ED3E3|nr:hypothetical protein [Evansella sp. AB-P1]MDG5786294.1 hypothetical protein [Evansella sp. AB-P1]